MKNRRYQNRHLRGFTLIEMGLVLVVIGLAVVGSISFFGPIADSRNAQLTTERMELVRKALLVHVIRLSCLPCPSNGQLNSQTDASAGLSFEGGTPVAVGSCATAACLVTDGVVPWRALGLSEQDASDAWGNRFRFEVAGTLTVPADCSTAGLQLIGGMLRTSGPGGCYPAGNLTVNDIDLTSVTEPEVSNAAYVIVSSGPDKALARRQGSGTFTGDRYNQYPGSVAVANTQGENVDNDPDFVTGLLNASDGTAHFDDIVKYETAANIIQSCGAQSCGNP